MPLGELYTSHSGSFLHISIMLFILITTLHCLTSISFNTRREHTYSEVYKEMDIEEYATSQYSEDNWMTRFLTNQMSGNVYDRHLDLAKEVLESKCLVGILEDFAESINRFDRYFGWSKIDFGGPVSMTNRGTCVARVMQHPDNAHPHEKVEEDGEVWNLLLQKNKYDLALYEHARHLFYDVQTDLVT